MSTLEIMDHAAYLRKVKKMLNHELQYVSEDLPWTLVLWANGMPKEVFHNNFLQGFISDLSAYFSDEKLAEIMEKTS